MEVDEVAVVADDLAAAEAEEKNNQMDVDAVPTGEVNPP